MRQYNRTANKAIVRRTVDMEAVEMGAKVSAPSSSLDDWKSVARLMVYDLSDEAADVLDKAFTAVEKAVANDRRRFGYSSLWEAWNFVRKCRSLNRCLRELAEAPFPGLAFVKVGWNVSYGVDESVLFLGSFETAEEALDAAKTHFDVDGDMDADYFRFSFADGTKPCFVGGSYYVE